VPLGELVDLRFVDGPGAIKSEAAQLVGYVYVDLAGRDTGGYMDDARKAVAKMVKLPTGYRLEWSGAFEGCLLYTSIRISECVTASCERPLWRVQFGLIIFGGVHRISRSKRPGFPDRDHHYDSHRGHLRRIGGVRPESPALSTID